MSSKKPAKSAGLPRSLASDADWDAPDPSELPATRSGAWRALGQGTSPNVARMGNPRDSYLAEPDTEETPATAHPGQFRFEDLFDDDEDELDSSPPPEPEPPVADALDEDAALAAVEAEITAARLARLDAMPIVTPPPVDAVVPDAVVAPAPTPVKAPSGLGWAGWGLVVLGMGAAGAGLGYAFW